MVKSIWPYVFLALVILVVAILLFSANNSSQNQPVGGELSNTSKPLFHDNAKDPYIGLWVARFGDPMARFNEDGTGIVTGGRWGQGCNFNWKVNGDQIEISDWSISTGWDYSSGVLSDNGDGPILNLSDTSGNTMQFMRNAALE